jgi:hypothetical protein
MVEDKQIKEAQAMVKAVHDDGCAEINGREYKITNVNHKKRRKVFSYFTHIQEAVQRGDFLFLDSPEWESVEKVINNIVTVDGNLLDKVPDHWEKYPQDYLLFVQTMLGAISYPFLAGLSGS